MIDATYLEFISINGKQYAIIRPSKTTGLVFGRYAPCRRTSDGAVGLFDIEYQKFLKTADPKDGDAT